MKYNFLKTHCLPKFVMILPSARQILTKMPAFFTARGSPRSPVPMLPFNRWIKVWNHLKQEEGRQGRVNSRY